MDLLQENIDSQYKNRQNKERSDRKMSACKKYVTDNVIVIGREEAFSRSTRQTDKHCAPRETIPCLLLNQFLAFQSRFLQTILIALHTIPQPPFFL